MARPKKETRETSKVTLRRKPLSKGRESLYLDIYDKGKRSYEFLGLYLVVEKDSESRKRNKESLEAATAIRNKRENELIQRAGGIEKATSDVLLVDYMNEFIKQKKKTGQSESWSLVADATMKHLIAYKGGKTRLSDVDEKFVIGFIEYLGNANNFRCNKKLSKRSAKTYYECFVTALRTAVRKDLMKQDPTIKIWKEEKKPIKSEAAQRPYLTIDEVKALINAPYGHTQIKCAFLFSCFTGLRLSDVINLRWSDITSDNGQYKASIRIEKTRRPMTITLNKTALKYMPPRKDDFVFNLPTSPAICKGLRTWAKAAGIDKHITFHTARHTFATTQLTLGTDIYTVSKLLGHTNVATTQIYAEIIDKKKEESIMEMDKYFS